MIQSKPRNPDKITYNPDKINFNVEVQCPFCKCLTLINTHHPKSFTEPCDCGALHDGSTGLSFK
jgi:hypothetical protein